MMTLQPIAPRQAAHTAADHALRAAILGGELAAGARLPPERALAVTLGVSRLTLRAALATLIADGLVSVHHGRGYQVRDYRAGGTALLPGLVELAAAHGGLADVAGDLLRVRRYLAAAVLDALVARPPGAAAVAQVAAAVAAFAARAQAGATVDALATADLAVVAALLEATGSAVVRLCLNPIVAVVTSDPALRAALYADPARNVAGYRLLVAWLARPRPAAISGLVDALADHDAGTVARLARPRRRGSR